MKKIVSPRLALFVLLLLATVKLFAQQQTNLIDTTEFRDGAHHWYDIKDKSNVIDALPGHPVYRATEIAAIADNILLYQQDNGGWPKNYDMQAILSEEQKSRLAKAKTLPTTFDNGATYAQIAYLADAYFLLHDERYKTGVTKGLDFILSAQYANGGWPQYYPLENNYSRYITFNDDAYIGVMRVLKAVNDHDRVYAFLDEKRRVKIINAYLKGLDCILTTQISDQGGIPTAWCQQYDNNTLQPAWARKFEPPSICNGESAEIVLFLMSIDHPSPTVKAAIGFAVNWFRASAIADTKVVTVDAPEMVTNFTVSTHDKVVVQATGAPLIWTRYYELGTHRPVFCNRDSKLVYSLAEVERERRDGYGWYTYAPQKVLNRYSDWQKKWVL